MSAILLRSKRGKNWLAAVAGRMAVEPAARAGQSQS